MAAKRSDNPSGNFDKFTKKSRLKAEKKNDSRRQKEQRRVQRKKDEKESATGSYMSDGPIRLNRYIALSGVCSRRDADSLIKKGNVKVNGTVCKEMGTKVDPDKDKIEYGGKELKIKKFVYLLMNKPKNHITTVKDEKDRRTVMDIVRKYTKARLYPVGRLDRNTTGLLLFTNDGDLTKKLTHPSHEVPKLYHVRLNQDVSEEHLLEIRQGLKLDDGIIKIDKISYADGGMHEINVQIHSGRNRIVRRVFEHLGYEIVSLDRVKFGPLSKRNLPRGNCRILEEKEIGWLKIM